MKRLTQAEYEGAILKAKERKEKRKVKRKELFGKEAVLTKTQLKKKLWNLVSLYVRLRDKRLTGGKCRVGIACGGQGPIECTCHIVPSNDAASTRYDTDNLYAGCFRCNYGEKMHRSMYRQHHIDIFGKEWIELLEAKAKQIVQYKRKDYLDMICEFKARLEQK